LGAAEVNDAVRVPTGGLLTTARLAALGDFTLGLAIVSPSTRTMAGPGGTADMEPRVMQVLVVLADSAGQVVTRETLFERCWGGVYVGDDSLNRAVAAVRKLAADVAGGSFAIETIPRTGYRLSGAQPKGVGDGIVSSRAWTRRELAGGAAGLVALGGIGAWLTMRSRADARYDEIVRRAETALRTDSAGPPTIWSLQQAVAIRPDEARGWGLIALVNSILAPGAEPKDAPRMIDQAQDAARRALSIDPKEPNALLAMFELEGSTLDWFTRDQKLRQIIAIDPNNVPAMAELVLLLQAAGMNRESWNWNERAIALVPLSLNYLSKRALKHWIAGRVGQADKMIDQVRALYPTNPWAWWVRFLIFAMTGRPRAAQAMLNSNPKMIPDPVESRVWRTALAALIQPSAATIARARQASFEGAMTVDQTGGQSVMILSALGDIEAAFEIANGYLLGRGPIIRREQPGSNAPVTAAIGRINMQWMFTPPCAVMRADPRFGPLCDGIGLTEYWRKRGVKPDFMLIER
jgi:tetratricopeptide (TPR) repeat protein